MRLLFFNQKKIRYSLISLPFILIAILFFRIPQSFSAYVISDTTPPAGSTGTCSCPSGAPSFQCANGANTTTATCGLNACGGGNLWTKYQLNSTCYRFGLIGSTCYYVYIPNLNICSTGDKYNSSNTPVMNYGSCSCAAGSGYKTCCSGATQVGANHYAVDPYAPDEADCGGNTTVRCGGAGEPACGQAACNTLAPPPPTPTPTPIPAPNLVTQSTSLNGTFYEGNNVSFSATVKNTGSANAGGSNTQFRVCAGTNTCGDANSPIPLGTPGTASLGLGASTTVSSNTWSNIPRGTYSLRAWADINRAVSESNELDNGNWRTVCVEGKPAPPSLISPSDGSTGNSVNPTLYWTFNSFNNTCANNMAYQIRFGTAPTPAASSAIPYTGIINGTYSPGTLSGNTTYYWQVVKCNGLSCNSGPVWSFITGAGVPITVSPTQTPTPTSTVPPPTVSPGTINLNVTAPICPGPQVRLNWTVGTTDTQFNILKDGKAITSVIGTQWTSGVETPGQSHTWQVQGIQTATPSNIKTVVTPACLTPTPTPLGPTPTPTSPSPVNQVSLNSATVNCPARTVTLGWSTNADPSFFNIVIDGVHRTSEPGSARSWTSGTQAEGESHSWQIYDSNVGLSNSRSTRINCSAATPTQTSLPTPIPTYIIFGTTYIDSNKNGVQERGNGVQDPLEKLCTPSGTRRERENCEGSGATCSGGEGGTGPCWYDASQEQGYQGATVGRSGSSAPATTNSRGRYSFSDLRAGSYIITLTVPAGFSATTSNPVRTSVGPSTTVNFGIISGIQCSDGIDNDGDGAIDAVDPGCHTDGNSFNQASYNPNSPSEAEAAPTVLSGAVVIDSEGNNCASGTTPYTGAATITAYNSGGSSTGNDGTDGSGAYLISDSQAPGQRTAVISNIAGFQVRQVRFDNGAWTTSSLSGYTYGPFNFSANHALDFCVNNVTPWFQTTTGDVRMNSLLNKVPSGVFASADPTNPSVFYSSSFPSNFGSGRSSAKGWTVNDEYAYQDDFKNRNGTMSYSFYLSRSTQQNVTLNSIPGCSGGNCTATISNLATGAYHLNNGNLTITSYSHRAGARVLLLVNGDVAIRSNIFVPAGSLLIIAAKGDITIDRTIGTTVPSDTAANVSGILTAEGSVIADGGKCQGNTPDRRLNIGGSLISNSLKPFQVGASGRVVNNRSLCQQDVNYPSIYVSSRYDFVTQLTDFYKTAYTRWREVAP